AVGDAAAVDAGVDAALDAPTIDAANTAPATCAGGGTPEKEPNDAIGGAMGLTVGSFCGALVGPDQDFWTASANHASFVLTVEATGDAVVSIEAVDGTPLAEHPAPVIFTVQDLAGTIAVHVSSPGGAAQTY